MKRKVIFFIRLALLRLKVYRLSTCINLRDSKYLNKLIILQISCQSGGISGLCRLFKNGNLLSIPINSISPEVASVFNTANCLKGIILFNRYIRPSNCW